jgi:hypothetical protein
MNNRITFLLLCEGTSDMPLAQVIEKLVVRSGANPVTGIPRASERGLRSTEDKLEHLLEIIRSLDLEQQSLDFVVVHCDADSKDPEMRIAKIRDALIEKGIIGIPVVPVQMTEAWLLTDADAIRTVVGRPSKQTDLQLPAISRIEHTHDPKRTLFNALREASDTTGRDRKKLNSNLGEYRRRLLQRIDIDGEVNRLSSWKRMVEDVESIVHTVLAERR